MCDLLEGGREGIYQKDNQVYRPAQEWTPYVHGFLNYLHQVGFHGVPRPIAIRSDGTEVISFVEGQVYHDGLPEDLRGDAVIEAVARWLRAFHDHGSAYLKEMQQDAPWMLPKRLPVETLCHGDIAPYNMVMQGANIVGVIDFDTLHPGPRMWDLAYALYRFVPLMASTNPESFGTKADQKRRIRVFMQAYGRPLISEEDCLAWVRKRLSYLVLYMQEQADKGNVAFKKNIEDGHLAGYLQDMDYLRSF